MSEVKKQCIETLEKLGIPYERVDHEAAYTMEALRDTEEKLGEKICKNLFLCNRQETDFYLLLMPGDKPFKTKYLSKQLETARLSFGNETYMEEFLHTTPGSASVLGLMFDKDKRVRLVIDKEVYGAEYLCCHPCDNTATLKMKTKDVLEKFLPFTGHVPTVVELQEE